MKLRTSFFNPTLYKKDITRFAPLWILYTVVMMLIMLPLMNVGWNNSVLDRAMYRVDVLAETIGAMSVMNLLYGVLAAQLLFGELFNTRLCNALHAMPIRREARFGSHLAAGFSFSIVPNLLISVLMMQDLGSWWYAPLLWCGALTLQYLFFFGVAVLSMHCTGNRFAAVLVYAIVNFASMAALWFASVIFVPLMKGVILDTTVFKLLSPVVMLCTMNDFFSVNVSPNFHTFEMGTQWPVLWIYAAVGVAAMVGALLIYRRRALESAGDFMAVKWLRPIFLLIYTLCVGAFFAVCGSLFSGNTFVSFLIVGLAVGFFTGKMLLERTVRIFNLKSLLQLVILIVLMWLSLQAVQFDLFGIVRYVPKAEAVKEAQVVVYFYGRNKLTVSDPREMEILVNAHELALEEDGCKHGDQHSYEITYFMKDGRTVKRRYTLCRVEKAAATFEKLFDSPKAIFGYEGHWDDFTRSVTSIKVTGLARQKFLNAEDWLNFLDCLYADCENGKMGVKDALGEVLVPAEYDEIGCTFADYCRGFAVPVVRDGKMALVSPDGKGTMKTGFDYDHIVFEDCYYVLVKDGKKGLATGGGDVIIPAEMDEIYTPFNDLAAFTKDEKFGFAMIGYDLITEPVYESYDIVGESDYLQVV